MNDMLEKHINYKLNLCKPFKDKLINTNKEPP